MSVSIYIWGTTPGSPSSIGPGGNDFTSIVPFSDGPNGAQSMITIEEVIPGVGSAHLELWDLTNQITFAYWAPIWIVDNDSGDNLFIGAVQKVKMTPVATYRLWTVDCVDINAICDTTLVGCPDGSSWDVTDTSTGSVASQPGFTGTCKSLFSTYWQYALTVDTTRYVDTTLLSSDTFDRVTLRSALDILAGQAGPLTTWWLDYGTGHSSLSATTSYLHLTSFANVTSVGVAGSGTLLNAYGWLAGGPLTLLFPQGNPNVVGGTCTTLAAAITSTGATTISVTSHTGFPSSAFVIMVDAEQMQVTAGFSTDTWTVTRGFAGTSAATHASGASVCEYWAYVAPYAITDLIPDYTTTWDAENVSLEADYSAFRFSIYVRGATDYTYNSGAVKTGGSGWVGYTGDGGPAYLSDFYDSPNADTHALRNSLGGAALKAMSVPIIRGTADVILDPAKGSGVKLFHAGQNLVVSSQPMGIYGGNFFIMRCATSFLSGTDVRRVSLDWGTAAKLNTAQRRAAQKSALPAPALGASTQTPASADTSLAAGNSTVVSTQLTNAAGQPWAIAGKTVNWSCEVIDDAGTDVTATTSFTLSPTSSTTDAAGKASTTLTTDAAVTGVQYYVTASTPD